MHRFWELWGRWVGGFGIRDMVFFRCFDMDLSLGDIMFDRIVPSTECQCESKFGIAVRAYSAFSSSGSSFTHLEIWMSNAYMVVTKPAKGLA